LKKITARRSSWKQSLWAVTTAGTLSVFSGSTVLAHAHADIRSRTEAAEAPRVAVLPVEFAQKPAGPIRQQLNAALNEGVKRGRVDHVEAKSSGRVCNDECLKDAAQSVGATHVVRAKVAKRDRDYTLSIELFDSTTGERVADDQALCEICGVAEASELMADRVARLVQSVVPSSTLAGTIVVRVDPAGAEVFVDGEHKGEAPIEVELTPGTHVIRVTKPGFEPVQRVVTAAASVREIVRLHLETAQEIKPDTSKRDRRFKVSGAVTLGAGLALVPAGVALLILNDRPHMPSCDGKADVNGRCPQQYDTLVGGIALTAASAVLITVGSVLLARGAGRIGKDRKRARLRPTSSGFVVHF
jgi:hypothetical protein